MLRELHITNLAVIEDVSVTFDDGLNCFTGATGAGKSLLIGAFEILLCLRGATDMIRPGADEARVAGLFELNDPAVCAQIGPIIDATIEPGEQLLITRKLFASGRSSVSVNGQPTTTAMARAVGEQIVDVHGQHDHQFLLKPINQLAILDAYGQCGPLCNQFANTFGELRELEQRHEQLTASAALRRQQLELYKFQADEIDAALLVDGEYPELKARYALLSNLQR
ncbi:MAG: AAA family ATPase, partial [Phycisphaeraceae bacterium]|nr:AAA family ATPase [Phycisphaeraceae bacterium]